MRNLFITSIILFLGVFLISPVSAQQQVGEFLISPVNARLNLAVGEKKEVKFSVVNNSDQVQSYTLTETQFVMNPQGEISPSDLDSLDVLELNQNIIEIPAGESYQVTVMVDSSSLVDSGAYFPAINISQNRNQRIEGTGTGVTYELAFVIGINILGSYPTETVIVSNLEVSNPVTDQTIRVDYTISNITNHYTKPSGRLQIINSQGLQIYEEVINSGESSFAPGQQLSDSIQLTSDQADLSAVGQYRAELLVIDSQFDTADIDTASFWVIPIPILIIAVTLIFIILMMILGLGLKLVRKTETVDPKHAIFR